MNNEINISFNYEDLIVLRRALMLRVGILIQEPEKTKIERKETIIILNKINSEIRCHEKYVGLDES
jgi:hypothetical protein